MISKVNQETAVTFSVAKIMTLSFRQRKCSSQKAFLVVETRTSVGPFFAKSMGEKGECKSAKKKQMGWNDKSYLQRKPHRRSTAQNKENIKFTAKMKRSETRRAKRNKGERKKSEREWERLCV